MIASDSKIEAAIHAVCRAGILIRQVEQELVTAALTKDDRSPVTVADYASQAVVAHILAAHLGEVRLVGEEDADLLRRAENRAALERVVAYVDRVVPGTDAATVCDLIDRGAQEPGATFWTVDPIDGTKGFLRGDHYAVALAFIAGNRVRCAALACPKLDLPSPSNVTASGAGVVLVAARGEGTWVGPLAGEKPAAAVWRRLAVSPVADPQSLRILRSVVAAHTSPTAIDRLAAALATTAPAIALDSQAKYAVLAAGEAELLVRFLSPDRPDYREKIWDQAAGSLLVEEAGGRVTDLAGNALDYGHGRTLKKNRGVLATNGLLHEPALAAIQQIGA